MKSWKRVIISSASIACFGLMQTSIADETGVGRGNNTPDALPTDPMETEANSGWMEQLLEWFDMTVDE